MVVSVEIHLLKYLNIIYIILFPLLFGCNESDDNPVSSSLIDISSGLQLYYPFNNNLHDNSVNNIQGQNNGALLTNDRNGNPDNAFFFDGVDDFIDIGNPHQLIITDSLTLSVWINVNSFNSYGGIISKGLMFNGTELQGAYGIGVNKDNNKVFFDVRTERAFRRTVISTRILNQNEWYHIVGTFTPGVGLSLYINGSLDVFGSFDDHSISHTTSWSNNDVRIGESQQSQNSPPRFPGHFNGVIDEVRIYNRSLNYEEIDYLYNLEL